MRSALIDECPLLSQLCFRSKAVWGYDDAFMELCRDELTVKEKDICQSHVVVAQEDKKILGLAHLYMNCEVAILEKLFIEPLVLNKGVGTSLFNWALKHSSKQKASILRIVSDPFAKEFYIKMGARYIKDVPSQTGKNRFLPLFEYTLEAS